MKHPHGFTTFDLLFHGWKRNEKDGSNPRNARHYWGFPVCRYYTVRAHYGFIDNGRIVKEISSAELEASFRKCIRVTVSDTKILSRVLDDKGLEYTILSEQTAEIFGKISVTELTLELSAQNCEVLSMQEREESLENYYINLVGGGQNE